MINDENNRRQFIGDFLRLAGLFVPLAAWKAWTTSRSNQGIPENAPVEKRLLTIEAKDLINGFAQARGGSLIYHYQMFFPTFLSGNEIEKVSELKRLCSTETKTGIPIENARKHAIPAIAAGHALSTARGDEAEYLRDIFLETYRTAIVGDGQNRMGLGVTWSCMTAALVRNPYNWRNLIVGPQIINAASETCLEFIQGQESGLLLLHAATAAWQFLITYQSALWEREQIGLNVVQELVATNHALDVVRRTRSERFSWLHRMEQLIGTHRPYSLAVPGYMEMLLGRQHFKENSMERRVADYAMILRLQTIYHYHLAESESINPGYLASPAIANDMKRRNLAFLICYGLNSTDWPALKIQGRGLFTANSEKFFESLFSNFESIIGEAKITEEEEYYAAWYSKHVPFRNALPEETAAAKLYSDEKSLKVALEDVQAGVNDPAARLDLCIPALAAGLSLEMPAQIDKINRRDMLGEVGASALQILKTPQYARAFELLSKRVPEFLERLATQKPLVRVGMPSASFEILPNQTITDVSARQNLAGTGVIQSPKTEERRNVNTPEFPQGKLPREAPKISSLAGTAPLVAMLSSKSKKIRFPDMETAKRGFGLLYWSGHKVRAFGDLTFGVTSKEQLQILDENKVSYETVN